MKAIKNSLIVVGLSVLLLVLLEFVARQILEPQPAEPRYACAAAAAPESFTVFTYGGSTVFGTPTPEYGFVAQLQSALKTQAGAAYTVCNMGEGGRDSSGVLLDIEKTIHFKPDLIVVLTGHNEFLSPQFEATAMRRLRETAAELGMVRLARKLMPKPNKKQRRQRNILPDELPGFPRDSADFGARVARYQGNLEDIAELTGNAGVPVVVGTLPSNTLDWPPTYRRLAVEMGGVTDPALLAQMDRWLAAPESVDLQGLIAQLPPSAPVTQYLQAHQQNPLDVHLLLEAKDRDAYPWRAMSSFNAAVRGLPETHNHVELIDVETMLRSHSETGALGFELISDNCHPTPRANFLITRELAQAVSRRAASPVQYTEEAFAAYVTGLGDEVQAEYYLDNARYVMKVPFFHYAAARMYLEKAQELVTEDWRVWANLASLDLLQGNRQSALEHLNKALSLVPDEETLQQRRHAPYLQAALEAQGLSLDAIQADG